MLQLRGQGLDLYGFEPPLCISDPVEADSCPQEHHQNSRTAVTCAGCLEYPWEATSKLGAPGAALPHPAACVSLTKELTQELLR